MNILVHNKTGEEVIISSDEYFSNQGIYKLLTKSSPLLTTTDAEKVCRKRLKKQEGYNETIKTQNQGIVV